MRIRLDRVISQQQLAVKFPNIMFNPYIKLLGFLAGILGILQGITWTILSLFVILIYSKAWKPMSENNEITYGSILNFYFVKFYLNANAHSRFDEQVIANSTVLFSFAIVYLVFSLVWFTLSVHLCMVLAADRFSSVHRSFMSWAGITLLTSTVDLILFILLAIDFNHWTASITNSGDINHINLVTVTGIIMTMSIKGYVLWLLNTALAIGLVISTRRILIKSPPTVYDTSPPPPNTFNPAMEGNTNPAYTPDGDQARSPYAKPAPYFQLEHPPKPAPKPAPKPPKPMYPPQQHQNTPFAFPSNDRFAKIGKPTSKSPPPFRVPPPKVPNAYVYPTEPKVPSPDYSPPSSPFNSQLKSALKNRPNYGNDGRY